MPLSNRYFTLLSSLGLCIMTLSANADCNFSMSATTPSDDFTISLTPDAATAIHKKTGLTWMVCSLGTGWDNNTQTCLEQENTTDAFTWENALQQAENFTYAGYSNWRLPNKKELASIIEYRCSEPAINENIFPEDLNGEYWTSSPVPYASSPFAWYINTAFGTFSSGPVDGLRYVRLVRD